MKKTALALFAIALVAGCSNKEQLGLKDALVAKFKDDQDLKDYKLDPGKVADCVVEEITGTLPGFPGDPRRERYFEAYARFVAVKTPGEAEQAIRDYAQLFGSAKEARAAATSITDHVMTCMGKAIEEAGGTPREP
ncbi:hypothetical protein [Candidatus Methylocalor cossyra]|uniref:Lipoprotein n=1 Tax=Candidatus Methylocalor cossyra TaxID=3108543 RepID=A0ABM9NG17_9GAMM